MYDTRDKNNPPPRNTPLQQENSTYDNHDAIITPVNLTVKEEKNAHTVTKPTISLKLASIIISLVIIILGSFLFFNYITKDPAPTLPVSKEVVILQQQVEPVPAVNGQPKQNDNVDKKQIVAEKKDVEQNLSNFLQIKNEVEGKGVVDWGGKLYDKAILLSNAADNSFLKKEYAVASKNYVEATALLNELINGMDDTLQSILDQGQAALNEGNGDIAQQLFRVALMIEPENELARHNLVRANNSKTVMELITSGRNHEKNNNLSLAYADYQDAVQLDPELEMAQTALYKLKNLIDSNQFNQFISSGFQAFNRDEYKQAQSQFLKAQSIKPDSQEIKDALTQVDTAIQLARIEDLQNEALEAEHSEDWERAIASYQAVLKIDTNILFAVQGADRTRHRNLLKTTINKYLGKPSLLESDRSLENATRLVVEAEQIEPKGPLFLQQFKRLDELVTVARILIPVTIESDNMTDVVIYKVGKLGHFQTHKLNLRPKTYTIVGTRNGFKDVRQNISVNATKNHIHITVICTESI